MAQKKYSKSKLKLFKKSIEEKLSEVEHDLWDIKENLDKSENVTN